ncbi:MAG: hypothetical protein V2A56_02610 [bacterium]
MASSTEIRTVPYRQSGEPPRKAAIVPVEVDLSRFDDEQIQMLGHLIDASDGMNPIFRDQFDPFTEPLRELLLSLAEGATGEEKRLIDDYLTVLNLQNGPWSLLPRKNHLLEIPYERLAELATGRFSGLPEELESLLSLLTSGQETPAKANFYPPNITEDELKNLGEAGKLVNTSVVRDQENDLHVIRNEDRYSETLGPVLDHLAAARDLSRDVGLRLYLDAKILELVTGSEEARRLADFTWVRHCSSIDIVISTALEVYLDDWKNFRGAATGGVYVTDESMNALLHALTERVPRWEAQAPWTYRREQVDPETLPKLKFVNVLTWSGDYVTGPFTTLAQSLPNEEWVAKNIGTVNMVYVNTGKAIHRVSGNLSAKEFLTKAEFERVADRLFDANQLHSALHEIGHTTGRQAPEASVGQPSGYLEDEYSWLEETRAELFGLFALDLLLQEKVADKETVRACYDGMLLSMVMSLKFDPVQAHTKARNGMFHALEAAGVIRRVEVDGTIKFELDHGKGPAEVKKLLKRVADLKATGDKAGATVLRNEFVRPDELKAEIDRRTADFPLGRGLIFPRLKKVNGRYTGELDYAAEFSDQEKFSLPLLD